MVKYLFGLFSFVFLCVSLVNGATYYVSPTGTVGSAGTINNPWQLRYSFTNNTVVAGDTLILRGGTYTNSPFHPWYYNHHNAPSNNPVVVRGMTGEKPIIDGKGITNGYTIYSSAQGVIFRDFEIMDSGNLRAIGTSNFWNSGLFVVGPHTKMYNLLVHDCSSTGIGFWEGATNSEIVGCTIYNCGSSSYDHGTYSQNEENSGVKVFRENILFNNYGYGLQSYGKNGQLTGFSISNNISYNNGSLALNNQRYANFFIGGLHNAVNDCYFVNNVGFMPTTTANGGSYGIGYYQPTFDGTNIPNRNVLLMNNLGSGSSLGFHYFSNSIVLFNTNIMYSYMGVFPYPLDSAPSYNWNSNSWFFTSGGSKTIKYPDDSTLINTATWKSTTGLDANSEFVAGWPSNSWTRFYLRTDVTNRANIAIYNWTNAATVSISISPSVPLGSTYTVRMAHDYYGDLEPISTGINTNGIISIPMSSTTIPIPIGQDAPESTAPTFNAFTLWWNNPVSSTINTIRSNKIYQ